MQKFLFQGTYIVETQGLIEVHADSLEEALNSLNSKGAVSVRPTGSIPIRKGFKDLILYSQELLDDN